MLLFVLIMHFVLFPFYLFYFIYCEQFASAMANSSGEEYCVKSSVNEKWESDFFPIYLPTDLLIIKFDQKL